MGGLFAGSRQANSKAGKKPSEFGFKKSNSLGGVGPGCIDESRYSKEDAVAALALPVLTTFFSDSRLAIRDSVFITT